VAPVRTAGTLAAMTDRWVRAGIITQRQADQIQADAGPVRGTSLVIEAMGYLGGVVILVALGLLTGWAWHVLSTGWRVATAAAVSGSMIAAGAAVPAAASATGRRLRAVLWLTATVALAGFLALLGAEGFAWTDHLVVAVFAAAGAGVGAAALWFVHRHPVQHAAVLVSLLVAAGTAAALLRGPDALPGLAVWGVGAAWLALSWGGLFGPRRVGMILAAAATATAAAMMVNSGWATVLALLTVAALVLLAVAVRDLILLAVGSLATLVVLPAAVTELVPGAVSAGLALLAVGLALIGLAVLTARRRPGGADRAGHDWSAGTTRVAVAVAAAAVLATTATVLAIGLA